MKPKTIKTTYWTATIIFALLMLMDGIGGITQQQAGQDVLKHLGYPMYLLLIVGTAKLLGVIAIVQTKYRAVKEWAYAGFAFNFISGFASRAFVGDSFIEIIFPLIMLAILFIPYSLWKKYEPLKNTLITA